MCPVKVPLPCETGKDLFLSTISPNLLRVGVGPSRRRPPILTLQQLKDKNNTNGFTGVARVLVVGSTRMYPQTKPSIDRCPFRRLCGLSLSNSSS